MQKMFIFAAALLLVGAGCSTTANVETNTTPSKPADQTTTQPTETPAVNDTDDSAGVTVDVGADVEVNVDTPKLVEFTVTGKGLSFDLKEMKVKKGDKVKVTFINAEGFHDWVLDEFNVKTKQIAAGQSETVEFTADKTGTFEYYCSVGKHRQNGMFGKLIVE